MASTVWSELTGNPGGNQLSPSPYRFLAVLLLAGFLLPLIEPRQGIVFLNIWLLLQEGVPGVLIFLALYPLLAAIGVFVLTNVLAGWARGAVMAGIGLLPLLMFLFEGGSQLKMFAIARPEAAFASVLSSLGMIGLFAGGLAICFQRENLTAVWTGGVGGGLFLVSLLVPRGSSLETVGLYQPFLLMQAGGFMPFLVGFLTLAGLVCLVLSSVFMLLLTFSRPMNEEYGRKSYRLALAWLVVTGVTLLMATVAQSSEAPRGFGGASFVFLLNMFLKLLLWVGPAFVLIPLGLADFLLEWAFRTGAVAPAPAPAPAWGGAVNTGGADGAPRFDYDKAVRELEVQRNRGEISTAEYWKRREELLQRRD
ncbi:MAG: hypothetical protein KA419_14015 [Acidobacteria bacterium]|nr:hypothetical protein [Acidobacteriota bacterium]